VLAVTFGGPCLVPSSISLFHGRGKFAMAPQVRARSVGANLGPFWQARCYDRNSEKVPN
jgi:hypothetical protein